ncbi:hypothetical protein HK405_005025, partial [Cladochytrium tenue]
MDDMDDDDDAGGGGGGSSSIDSTPGAPTTARSQLVLRECFRTVKEATALAETVVARLLLPLSPLAQSYHNDQNSLSNVVEEVGDALCLLLTKVRHRGAFSGVHSSLCALVEQVARSASTPSAHQTHGDHPRSMASVAAVLLERWLWFFVDLVGSIKTMSTRRSGGMPLGVAAVLRSPFPTRPALVEKLRARDEHDSVNSVTGREFFAKYPDLYGFLVQDLDRAVKSVEQSPKARTLLTLSVFRPLVARCRSSGIYQVRLIAARAFVSLLSASDLGAGALSSLLADVVPSASQNEIHGALLQIDSALSADELRDTATQRIRSDVATTMFLGLNSLSAWLLSGRATPVSFLNRRLFVELLIKLADSVDQAGERAAPGEPSFRGQLARFILILLIAHADNLNDTDVVEIMLRIGSDRDDEVRVQIAVATRHALLRPILVVSRAGSASMPSVALPELAYESLAALVALDRDTNLPLVVDKQQALSIGAAALWSHLVEHLLARTRNPQLVASLLPYCARLLVQFVWLPDRDDTQQLASEPNTLECDYLATSFLEAVKRWGDHTADNVRLTLAAALEVIAPTIVGHNKNGRASQSVATSTAVSLIVLLDGLLTDEDPAVRDRAAAVASVLVGAQDASQYAVADAMRVRLYAWFADEASRSGEAMERLFELLVVRSP